MYLPRPSDSGGDFQLPPAGTFPAICYRIIDLGTQQSFWNGQEKSKHQVMLSWELKGDDTIMDDGRPMTIHQRYTWSMSEKATLRRQLEAWLSRKFVDTDFGEGGFDVRSLLELGCLLSIVHEEKSAGTFANVTTVTRLPKGMTAGSLINKPVFLWIAPGVFDRAVFETLSSSVKEKIAKSPEYRQLAARPAPGRKAPANSYREASQSYHPPKPPPEDDYERWGPPHGEEAA